MERKVDRLLQYLEYKGISENRATIDCELSKGLIGQAKSGRADLGAKTVEKILKTYQDLSRVWLITGTGSMLSCDQPENPMKDKPELVAKNRPALSSTEIVLRDMLAEERAKNDALHEVIWDLKEEVGRLKGIIASAHKGGDVESADSSSSADAV